MNNTQVAVLASFMRTGGRNMTSVEDALEDSKAIEAYLDEQDSIKARAHRETSSRAAWDDVTESLRANQAAENVPGSFEALVPPTLRAAH